MTATERKRRERERRRAEGQVRIEAWIPAEAREAVETAIQEACAAYMRGLKPMGEK